MVIKKVNPMFELMQQYVTAVNGGNKRLANKLIKQIDELRLPTPVPAGKIASKAGKVSKVKRVAAKPKVTDNEKDYIRPTRIKSDNESVDEEKSTKHVQAQWRNVGNKPFVNKFVDDGKSNDLPLKHQKVDKKLAKTKRRVEPRDSPVKVKVKCFVCNKTFEVYSDSEALERYSDEGDGDRVTKVKSVRCDRCLSIK